MQATIDIDAGSEEDDAGLAAHAPCVRGRDVLVSGASGSQASGTGGALSRHRAFAKLAFLVEPPHAVVTCMLGQVSQDIRASFIPDD